MTVFWTHKNIVENGYSEIVLLAINAFRIEERNIIIGLINELRLVIKCDRVTETWSVGDCWLPVAYA